MGLDFKFMGETFWLAIKAVPTTLLITIVTLIFSLPAGFILGFAAYKKVPVLSKLCAVYVSFMRGIPLILVIYIIYTVTPGILSGLFKSLGIGINIFKLNPIVFVFIVFTLNQSAAMSAIFKSSLETVNPGQLEAAYSIGLSPVSAYTQVILPQALTAAFPVLAGSVTDLIKGTSLAFNMTVLEITGVAKSAGAANMSYVEAYLDIFFIYIILVISVEKLFKLGEKRLRKYQRG
ncbi:MAG: amino acid ABC transporter permease [Lachnospiraceae bacterium]|nr:amino acid ABC transporter permease [Lachnospiraceae bacterium]